MKDDLIIERLDALRALVVRHGEDLGYVVIDEVVSRTKRRAVVRMDLTPEALADWLEEDELPAELDRGEAPEEGDDESDDEPDDEIPGEAKLNEENRALCRALLRWLPAELESQLGDRPKQTFKLSLYQPKGDYLESKNVRVWRRVAPPPPTEPRHEASLPPLVPTAAPSLSLPALTTPPAPSAPPTAAPVATPAAAPVSAPAAPVFAIALGGDGRGQLVFLDPDTIPEARVWRALGRATEELLVTVGRTYSGIIELQARTVLHQSEQLDRSQRLVETLTGRLLEARHVQAHEDAETRVDESQLRVREELGKTFLSELGTLGRVLVTSRAGVAPELAELSELVGGSPELSEAMRDPSVRAMLKDEGTRKELAQLLRIAARRGSGEDGDTPQAA